jgi:starch synthase
MNTAIYYQRDGFDTSGQKLMGRQAAGEEFLKAWAKYSQSEHLFCYAKDQSELKDFLSRTKATSPSDRKNVWIPWQKWQDLRAPGSLFVPGPGLGSFAYQRRYLNDAAYSLIGITHTTASNSVMDAIGELLLAPTQPWDALICTSNSVKDMVTRVIDAYAEHLKDRFGMSQAPKLPIQMPVIPLGVNTEAFDVGEEKEAFYRSQWRQRLGIASDEFVALYLGRLSFHAKAHPMPMYLGLERAAQKTGKKISLIMAGWFANDAIKNEFVTAAKTFAPSVNTIFIDGRKKEVRETIWFAADVFTSLSDNIQETFGLTPIEAMSAGLPVVCSDWDGYRETVRPGVDGFLIPTWMQAPGGAEDLAFLNATGQIDYDHYIGCQSQFTAVDVDATTLAFVSLVESPDLCLRMRTAAKRRMQGTYDWRIIVESYETMFDELAALRGANRSDCSKCLTPTLSPLRQDPTVLFQKYPSEYLSPETCVSAPESIICTENLVLKSSSNSFAIEKFALQKNISQILVAIRTNSQLSVSQVQELFASQFKGDTSVERAILWLAKVGLVKLRTTFH